MFSGLSPPWEIRLNAETFRKEGEEDKGSHVLRLIKQEHF